MLQSEDVVKKRWGNKELAGLRREESSSLPPR